MVLIDLFKAARTRESTLPVHLYAMKIGNYLNIMTFFSLNENHINKENDI